MYPYRGSAVTGVIATFATPAFSCAALRGSTKVIPARIRIVNRCRIIRTTGWLVIGIRLGERPEGGIPAGASSKDKEESAGKAVKEGHLSDLPFPRRSGASATYLLILQTV